MDSIVKKILQEFKERADAGKKKYKKDLDRNDLSLLDWLQHAKEELMDAVLYIEKIKAVLSNQKDGNTTEIDL